jgi:hypothetical protein
MWKAEGGQRIEKKKPFSVENDKVGIMALNMAFVKQQKLPNLPFCFLL